jgi:lipid II:glycine glycyltransferase (peptidoglycan interpeptide bridge formation enzyme)
MKFELFNGTQQEWNDQLNSSTSASIMQLWEFGEAKKELDGWELIRYTGANENGLQIAFNALIKRIPLLGKGLVFINRPAYFIDINEKNEVLKILESLKKFWVDDQKMFLMVDPSLPNEKFSINDLQELGFHPDKEDEVGWATDIISLQPTEEELRKGLKAKWRNCLNKSEKLGVTTTAGKGKENVDKFINDYKLLIKEIGFKPGVSPEFIYKMCEISGFENSIVITATCEGEDVGSILVPKFGNTSIYLASGAHSAGKKLNVAYKLLWEAMLQSKKEGLSFFDVGGANEVTTPKGILHFKRGLGGAPVSFIPKVTAYKKGMMSFAIKKKLAQLN